MQILREIRQNDVIYTRNGEIKVERIHREALKVLNWYWRNIAVNQQ